VKVAEQNERFIRNARLVGVMLAALYLARYFRTWSIADSWSLLDDIDLAIHEAGHMVFMPFGEFMMVLGGSLFQVLVPAVFVAYFARQRQWFSAFFVLMWVGQSLFNLSYYIADARARELPLITGDPTTHDWTWLLIQMQLLQHDVLIGDTVRLLAAICVLGGIAACTRIALHRTPEPLKSFASTTPIVARER